ncbi:T6SS immunity protein Tli4 family protein [Pantoea stewartii subsp. indologenes]|uniref:T6SS immunity protein Tli4 family protein n=1 Tax=Pantoea stewartii TaxID=66269 RepID=UPI001981CCC8|nr:T6SS immunity protein Tli4 family protein [Pantoea stewartii]MDK2634811.1 T6SS immunity protein Tli4 family protein [Pantoea stewartii subsp. indologenes]
MKLKKYFVMIFVVAAGLSGYYSFGGYPPKINLTAQENDMVNAFLDEMTTRCVGRYLIDIPKSYSVTSDNVLAFINNASVKTKRVYRPAFEQKIRLREEALMQEKTVDPQDMPYLKQVYPLPAGMVGVIFERNESGSVPDAARILEAHLYTNGIAVEVAMEAENGLSPRYDKFRKQTPDVYRNSVPNRLAELTRLLKRISGKKDTEIPQQAGFCLPEIFIADGAVKNKEEIDVTYTSDKYPRADFDFSTDNFNKTDDTMLDRSAEVNKDIKAAEGRTIQKGKREINSLYTEEWLVFGSMDNDEKGLRFVFHANENVIQDNSPWMYISFLQRGLSGNNQLSENEAVSAWEKITSTLRLRPGAFQK